jgi:hypothetical protein
VKEEKKVGGAGDVTQAKPQQQKKGPKTHIPSEEPGFTGEPSEWFDDIAFKKQLITDLTYNDQKHDYYFGSYSHFYIHEEMLKD